MRVIEDDETKGNVIDNWLNGYHSDSAGSVDTSYGHFIYDEMEDRNGGPNLYYAVRTDSIGNTWLLEFASWDEMDDHRSEINALDEMETENV